jgi:hypothetical protein
MTKHFGERMINASERAPRRAPTSVFQLMDFRLYLASRGADRAAARREFIRKFIRKCIVAQMRINLVFDAGARVTPR